MYPDNRFELTFTISQDKNNPISLLGRDIVIEKVLQSIEKEIGIKVEYSPGYGIEIKVENMAPGKKERVLIHRTSNDCNISIQPILENDTPPKFYELKP